MITGLLASNATSWVFIGIILVALVAFFVWSTISQKKKQKEFNRTIDAVKPGSKVKTIGGVCGEVVEVNDEENTFVLKTGTSDGNSVSYMKFDKQAIYQTDAKPEDPAQEVKAVKETKVAPAEQEAKEEVSEKEENK